MAAAGAANQQAFVCEVVLPVNGLPMGAEGRLDRIPELLGDQRCMTSRPAAPLPAKLAFIERVLEQPLEQRRRKRRARSESGSEVPPFDRDLSMASPPLVPW